MNKVFLMGNLTRDVDFKSYGSTDVAKSAVAVNRPFSKGNAVDFFNITAFGKTAEFLSKYFSKGSKILVEGRLQTSSYEKDGIKHNAVDVIVDQIYFAGTKKEPDNNPAHNNNFDAAPVDVEDTPF